MAIPALLWTVSLWHLLLASPSPAHVVAAAADQVTRPNTTLHATKSMSPNKQAVEQYMQAFDKSDHAAVLSLLTDDVEWVIPGVYAIQGKAAFDQHIGDDAFVGSPGIVVTRMTEQGDVVVAEGRVSPTRRDGTVLHLVFCDVFEMRGGRIRRLTSYLMEVKA